jgi:DNA/RNA-binding domain of Phe-tRNA-synthetase-like protein
MEFRVVKDVLDAGVKILFDVIEGIDNATHSEKWDSFRDEKIKELLVRYQDLDVHQDPILDGYKIRQVLKTLVTEETKNIFYIVQGNAATSEEYLREGAQQIIDLTTKFCGGRGRIVVPEVV